MKIHQLPLGARFAYEGVEYVKSGPLTATAQGGGQRLIPKFALLRVLDGSQPLVTAASAPVSRDAVRAAFDRFWAECLPLIPATEHPAATAARAAFLKTLD